MSSRKRGYRVEGTGYRIITVVISVILALVFVLYLHPVFADEIDDLQKQIDVLNKAREQSVAATTPLEGQLGSLQRQLAQIQAQLQVVTANIAQKETDLKLREDKLVTEQALLASRVRSYYIRSFFTNPFIVILSSASSGDLFRELTYRQAATRQDQKVISSVTTEMLDLLNQKDVLEKEKARMGVIQAQVDKNAQFLSGEIKKAKDYQATLSNQIAQLSAQQQSLIAAKQAALSSSAGKSIDTQTSASACGVKPLSSYPDTIRVKFSDGHVETMPFEDQYLKGLGEMPRAWESVNNHGEAFKAQVIAARTYALFKMIRSSCRDFDVYSDTRDQVYSGDIGDGDWNGSVSSTKGQFLQNGGNVIIAYYAANSGGYTLTPNQSWGGGGDFPAGINDISSDGKGNGDLGSRCIGTLKWEYHYNIGRNGGIQYNDTCPGGDISNNNSPLSGSETEDIVDATIWALKNGHIPDNSMTHDQIKSELGGDAIGSIQSISANITNNQFTSTIHVSGSRIADLNAQTFRLVFNVRSPGQFLIPSTSYGAQFVKFDVLSSSDAHGTQGSGWYFYTYGYGHRIGLDQEGALGMAYQGRKYTDILSHYYQGTTITANGYSGQVQ